MNFISITTKVIESESYSVMSDSLQPHGLYSPWNSPGQSTGVGCHLNLSINVKGYSILKPSDS